MKKFTKVMVLSIFMMFIFIGCSKDNDKNITLSLASNGSDKINLNDEIVTVKDLIIKYDEIYESIEKSIESISEGSSDNYMKYLANDEMLEVCKKSISLSESSDTNLKKCVNECEEDSNAYIALDSLRLGIVELGEAAKELKYRIDNDIKFNANGDRLQEHLSSASKYHRTYIKCLKKI